MAKGSKVWILIVLGVAVSGCASARGDDGMGDPLEPLNRTFFKFNQTLDKRAALPAATFYKSSVPAPVRAGVHNFLTNLNQPITFANDILQGETKRAQETVERFAINTTLGVLGVLDPATQEGIPLHTEDFGQTMAVYGVPGGPYLVLPLIGSTQPRDLGGRYVDHYFNPLNYVTGHGKTYWSLAASGFSLVDVRSRNIDTLRDIERQSVDDYATLRSLYLQNRQNQINNGRNDPSTLPDF